MKLHFHAEIEPRIVVNEVSTVALIISRGEIHRRSRPTANEDHAEAAIDSALILETVGRRNVELAGRSRLEATVPDADDPKGSPHD